MENKIIPFNYQGNEVRSISLDGEPWFVAKDVCDILEMSNVTVAISRLDDDEVTKLNLGSLSGEVNIISESGLYSLTLSSKKPEAKPFKRWVTRDVIPTIRKTGSYTAKPMSQIEMLAAQAQAMCELEKKTDMAIEQANQAKKSIDSALNVLAAPVDTDWQSATGDKIKRIAQENELTYPILFGNLYKELENLAHVNLSSRVSRLKDRMKKAGATYKERQAITKLHVVGADPQLRLAFDGIVRRIDAKYSSQRLA